jgi:hypothetical protein
MILMIPSSWPFCKWLRRTLIKATVLTAGALFRNDAAVAPLGFKALAQTRARLMQTSTMAIIIFEPHVWLDLMEPETAWSCGRLGWSYWAAKTCIVKWMDPQRAETSIFARSFVSDKSVNTSSSTTTGPQPTSTASRPRPRFFAVGTAGHGRQLGTIIYVVTYRFVSSSGQG